jgi:hypothetical protein
VYGLKQVVQVVTVVTRLFLLSNFCHHLVTTSPPLMGWDDLAMLVPQGAECSGSRFVSR